MQPIIKKIRYSFNSFQQYFFIDIQNVILISLMPTTTYKKVRNNKYRQKLHCKHSKYNTLIKFGFYFKTDRHIHNLIYHVCIQRAISYRKDCIKTGSEKWDDKNE